MAPRPLPRTTLRCAACGGEQDPATLHGECPACGGLFDVRHEPATLRGAALRTLFEDRRDPPGGQASGVWRFREMVLPDAGHAAVSWPEGNTPLLEIESVARFAGLRHLALKHEGMNPTGSFKDRGMTAGVTMARIAGARAVACASTGNTSASMAAYAARAGLPALVLVPAGRTALGKLAQALAYGARTLLVRGDFDACLALAREAARRLGVYLLNSVNPYRLEGQKTIVFEMLMQRGWDPPDWILVPAGNLGNTAAFGKALREARESGLIDRLPRIAAVQAAGANPFARSFRDGFRTRAPVKAETIATAIRIGNPASHDRAVAAIRGTGGVVTDVTDAEILEAKAVIDAAGIGCEPASAAAVAGARRLVAEGVIAVDQSVVAILTGHVLKDPEILIEFHRDAEPPPGRANRPIEVDPEIGAVERALEGK